MLAAQTTDGANAMQNELSILALYGLWVIVIVLLHVLSAVPQLGLPYLVSPRDQKRELTGMPGRLHRALDNSLIALAMFAPAILVLAAKDAFTGTTLLAAQVFLIARVLYVGVYLLGTPYLRTLIWLVGFLMTAWLYLVAL